MLGVKGRLFRVQCKWGKRCEDGIEVRLRSSYHSPSRGYVIRTYDEFEVDFVAAYCGDMDRSYLLPAGLIAGRTMIFLRLDQTRNNQRAALNWAADYEFPGAVAQLEERSDGIRKAEGSSPSSSTLDVASPGCQTEEVGAHVFRNHFGYYMERAAAGTEILIRRRGKPYARLGPAILKDRPVPADE